MCEREYSQSVGCVYDKISQKQRLPVFEPLLYIARRWLEIPQFVFVSQTQQTTKHAHCKLNCRLYALRREFGLIFPISFWQFEEIVEKAKAFAEHVSKEDVLEFYGYYKQATVGDCNIEEPEDEEKKARYLAWKSKAGLTAEDAKNHYIEVYKKHAAKFE